MRDAEAFVGAVLGALGVVEAGCVRGAGPQPFAKSVEIPAPTFAEASWTDVGKLAGGGGGEAAADGTGPDAWADLWPKAQGVGRVEGWEGGGCLYCEKTKSYSFNSLHH